MTVINHDMSKKENVFQFMIYAIDNNEKYSIIQNAFAKGFWKIWKADKNNAKSEFRRMFPNAKVWKHPDTGEWRVYFNEDKAELEAQKDGIDNGMTPADYEHQAYLDEMSQDEYDAHVALEQHAEAKAEMQIEIDMEMDREDTSIKREIQETLSEPDWVQDTGEEPMPTDYDMIVSKSAEGDLTHAGCDEDYAHEEEEPEYYCSKCDKDFTNPQEFSEHKCYTYEDYCEDENDDYLKHEEQKRDAQFEMSRSPFSADY